ncbi:MAG: cupin domain-containing protein [Tindallia sp. MSAO_Bac2]|nr:MAG: cupin domain-containing protein [Tindallia sp. MSAO_Bac2]
MSGINTNHGEGQWIQMLDGVRRKNLVVGEKTMLCEFELIEGAKLPLHQHPHEQTGYLISGSLRFEINGEAVEMKPGDSWCIPGNVEHKVDVLENTKLVETFTPVREDFL